MLAFVSVRKSNANSLKNKRHLLTHLNWIQWRCALQLQLYLGVLSVTSVLALFWVLGPVFLQLPCFQTDLSLGSKTATCSSQDYLPLFSLLSPRSWVTLSSTNPSLPSMGHHGFWVYPGTSKYVSEDGKHGLRLWAHLWTCIRGRVSHIQNTWLLFCTEGLGWGRGLGRSSSDQQQNCSYQKKHLRSETLIQDVCILCCFLLGNDRLLSREKVQIFIRKQLWTYEDALTGWDGWKVRLWGLTAWFQRLASPVTGWLSFGEVHGHSAPSLPHIL